MKYAVVADLHIKNWSDSELEKETNVSRKLTDILNVVTNVCEYCIDNNISNIICAGDVGHLKGIVHTKSFILFKNIISKYKTIHWYIIPGNHDISSHNQDQNSAQLLEGLENVTVFSKPAVKDGIHYVPWMPDIAEYIKTDKRYNECSILVSHFGLNEAQIRSGQSIVANIGAKDIMNYGLVLLGHYHYPQTVGNAWYVGSPIQLNRGEADQAKRFLVVDSDTLEVESIETKGYMKHYNLVIDDEDTASDVIAQAKSFVSNGDDVTVRNEVVGIQGELEQSLSNTRLIDETEEDYQDRGITSSMDIMAQMKKYLDIMNVPTDKHEPYISAFSKYRQLIESDQ